MAAPLRDVRGQGARPPTIPRWAESQTLARLAKRQESLRLRRGGAQGRRRRTAVFANFLECEMRESYGHFRRRADGDMHLKNLALLKVAEPGSRRFESVRLAPLYDRCPRFAPVAAMTV